MAEEETNAPKFVVYQKQNVNQALALRAELHRSLRLFRKLKAHPAVFSELVDEVHGRVEKRGVSRDVLHESLRDLVGTRLSSAILWDACWRVATNLPRLSQNRPVPTWTHQSFREKVYAQVAECELDGRDSRGRVRHALKFLILTGTPAGMTTTQKWTRRRQDHIAHYRNETKQGFMFTRRRGGRRAGQSRFPYDSPNQFVGMRCMVVVTPDESGEDPGFDEIQFDTQCVTHNRELHKKRERIENGYDCPHGFPRTKVECRKCPIGYQNCPAGTHKHTYVFQECPRCKKPKAAFNPGSPAKVCIACEEHQILHPEED